MTPVGAGSVPQSRRPEPVPHRRGAVFRDSFSGPSHPCPMQPNAGGVAHAVRQLRIRGRVVVRCAAAQGMPVQPMHVHYSTFFGPPTHAWIRIGADDTWIPADWTSPVQEREGCRRMLEVLELRKPQATATVRHSRLPRVDRTYREVRPYGLRLDVKRLRCVLLAAWQF
jgi:hypothetical protein